MSNCSFLKFRSPDALSDVVAQTLAFILGKSISENGHASLLLSGGSTPRGAYERLGQAALNWDQVHIGLVDDRWVDETDPGSNAAMIRSTLLKGRAINADFHPLTTEHKDLEAGCLLSNYTYADLIQPYSIAVLGMGPDGHTASWFPDALGLSEALDPNSDKIVVPVRPKQSKVTGDYLERATLTLAALSKAKTVLLLITGPVKRRVYQDALNDPSSDLPIRKAIDAFGDRLTVYWAP